MTAALSDAFPPVGGWTTDDLDELPEDGHRRELIDGVLIVPPTPTNVHQTVAMRLGTALEATCPMEFDVTLGVEIRVSSRRSFIPDVLIVSSEAAAKVRSRFSPHEVLLVAEIVSPGSQSFDRFTKPALYGEAGIPLYWRIETNDGIVVHTHRLDQTDGLYVEDGVFTTVIDVEQPWRLQIPIHRLAPRFFPMPE